jgi:hypothetical protein
LTLLRGRNWWRLLVLPNPPLSDEDRSAFDALLARTPPGEVVDYALAQPRWWFLHHLVRSGFLLHGTNEPEIAEFRTRANDDAHGRPVDAVFASDDAVWPMYFAVVNRPVARSYINWCEHVPGASRYLFSIGSDPGDDTSWCEGTVYVLPAETFDRTPESRELVSSVPVRPRARLRVAPADFPFRLQTLGHGPGDTPRSVSIRNVLRPLSRRRPR